MNENTKEVNFFQYCPNCFYENEKESEDICHDCLNEPSRENSHKPINYKPKNR